MKKKPISQEKAFEAWAIKRNKNIHRMVKEMAKDDAYALKTASVVLSDISNVPWQLGDEPGSILLSFLAARLHGMYLDAMNKRPKKKRKKM